MSSIEIKLRNIKDRKKFKKDGDEIIYKDYYPETDTYVYERWSLGRFICWEVVRPVYVKRGDEKIPIYPGSGLWGSKGLTVYNSPDADQMISYLVTHKDWSVDGRMEFRRSLGRVK